MITLDATDRKILSLLQADGRMPNADLAGRVNLSPAAWLRRGDRRQAWPGSAENWRTSPALMSA